ncbi:hypothetical protein WICMUC_002407 [Wickerhamomyces mucosus]|uniref:Histone-lysine N-methyltransferase, H3 lysine-79 specific n=1 Tax=Wickerhamomyces mucosus TaxID=1378264 RepID=A0A9P8PR91_9ASCO|nr:hypothetical protein WICMUC_002407 [Wickerhamomyces mucosus]
MTNDIENSEISSNDGSQFGNGSTDTSITSEELIIDNNDRDNLKNNKKEIIDTDYNNIDIINNNNDIINNNNNITNNNNNITNNNNNITNNSNDIINNNNDQVRSEEGCEEFLSKYPIHLHSILRNEYWYGTNDKKRKRIKTKKIEVESSRFKVQSFKKRKHSTINNNKLIKIKIDENKPSDDDSKIESLDLNSKPIGIPTNKTVDQLLGKYDKPLNPLERLYAEAAWAAAITDKKKKGGNYKVIMPEGKRLTRSAPKLYIEEDSERSLKEYERKKVEKLIHAQKLKEILAENKRLEIERKLEAKKSRDEQRESSRKNLEKKREAKKQIKQNVSSFNNNSNTPENKLPTYGVADGYIPFIPQLMEFDKELSLENRSNFFINIIKEQSIDQSINQSINQSIDKIEQIDKPDQDKLDQDKFLDQDKLDQDKPNQNKLDQDKPIDKALDQSQSIGKPIDKPINKPGQDKLDQDKLDQDKPDQPHPIDKINKIEGFKHLADYMDERNTYHDIDGFNPKEFFINSVVYPNLKERYLAQSSSNYFDLDPLQEFGRLLEFTSITYFPKDLQLKIYNKDSPYQSIVGRYSKAYSSANFDELIKVIKEYNSLVSKAHQNHRLTSHLQNKNSFSRLAIHEILGQIYSRAVAPKSHILKKYKGFSHEVYGELLPKFISKIFDHTGLNSNSTFIDLGSGVGNVTIQAALEYGAESYGCELMENCCKLANEQLKEFHTRTKYYGLNPGKVELLEGDFNENPLVKKIIDRCDVILVNNFLFEPELNEQVLQLLENIKIGTKIISLKPILPASYTLRNDGNDNIFRSKLKVRCYEFDNDCVSWSSTGGFYYITELTDKIQEEYSKKYNTRHHKKDKIVYLEKSIISEDGSDDLFLPQLKKFQTFNKRKRRKRKIPIKIEQQPIKLPDSFLSSDSSLSDLPDESNQSSELSTLVTTPTSDGSP